MKVTIQRNSDNLYQIFLGKAHVGKLRTAEDGSFLFQPAEYIGYTAAGLRSIAEQLDNLNEEVREQILRREKSAKKKGIVELLNSEGPILTAQRLGDRYLLDFTQDSYMMEVSHRELCEFLAGLRVFATPEGKMYDYRDFSGDMKTDFMILYDFIRG